MRHNRGFTLVELLVVIVIIAILGALITVALVKVLTGGKANATELQLRDLAAAAEQYKLRWGDYPPSTMAEVGGAAGNEINRGIETLVGCLASRKKGSPLYQAPEDSLSNVDGDSSDPKLLDWYFGDGALREVKDVFGNVLFYIHSRDYASPKPGHLKVRITEGAADQEARVEQGGVSKTYLHAGRFQLRSAGPDGKFRTSDDIGN